MMTSSIIPSLTSDQRPDVVQTPASEAERKGQSAELTDKDLDFVDAEGRTALHKAVINKELDSVKRVLGLRPQLLDNFDKEGKTALMHAAICSDDEIFGYLLQKRAAWNLVSGPTKNSVLHWAALHSNKQAIFYPLDIESLKSARNHQGNTPLHLAAKVGNVNFIMWLISVGGDFDATNSIGYNALHIAVIHDQTEAVRCLAGVKKKGNAAVQSNQEYRVACITVNSIQALDLASLYQHALNLAPQHKDVEQPQRTALHYAAAYNRNSTTARILINSGFRMDQVDLLGRRAIHYAAMRGHSELLEMFGKDSSSLEARTAKSFTPLHLAAKSGDAIACTTLLTAKADITAKDKYRRTAFFIAAQNGKAEVVQLLSGHKESVEMANVTGLTPLLAAAKKGHRFVCEILLGASANIFARNKDGLTALHLATKNEKMEVVQFLSGKKELLKAVDSEGLTALHHAAGKGFTFICQILVKAGLDPNVVDKRNRTPLYHAAASGRNRTVQYLCSLKDTMNWNPQAFNPLHAAANEGLLATCQLLIQLGADRYATNNDGTTFLHTACARGYTDVVAFYASDERLREQRKKDGTTPLLVAAIDGKKMVFDVLVSAGADLLATDKLGRNFLHLAAQFNTQSVVKDAIYQELATAVDKEGFTPAQRATKFGHKDFAALLQKALPLPRKDTSSMEGKRQPFDVM